MEAEKKEIRLISSLKAIENFKKLIDHIQCDYPYRLNVIEELHINENAHSRILARLLQYRSPNDQYVFLESLLHYINCHKHVAFPSGMQSSTLEITQETERIDLWIRDKNFAIILENKACGAGDQESQLYRYIDKTKKRGYKEQHIYIIYLPPTEDKNPTRESWNGLENLFKERYVKLSYREDIIKWLETDIIPNIRIKDQILLAAMVQYCDYLKESFNLNNNDMRNKIKELFDKELSLPNDLEEKAGKLDKVISECQEVVNELNNYRNELEEEFSVRGAKEISEFLSHKRIPNASNLTPINVRYGGFRFIYDNKQMDLVFGRENKWWYVQIQWPESTPIEERMFPESIWKDTIIYKGKNTSLNQRSGNNYIWRYCYSLKEAFDVFDNVLTHIIEISNS